MEITSEDHDPVDRGGLVTYTIEVTNLSANPATDVTELNTLSQNAAGGARIVSTTTDQGICFQYGWWSKCVVGTIAPGQSSTPSPPGSQ